MRRITMLVLLLAGVSLAVSAPAGTISGTITNPEKCKGVQIIKRRIRRNRVDPVIVKAGFDPKTGLFQSGELTEGTYDLRILIEGGMFEGVDMRVQNPDNVEPGELTVEDKVAINKEVTKPVATYLDFHRTLLVKGNSLRACALVEAVRHRKAHARPKGEVTWYIQLWYYENWTGAWVRPAASRGRRKVLWRLRSPADIAADKFRNMVLLLSPDIGGLDVTAEKSVKGLTVTIPDPDMALGKVAGSVAKQIEEDRKKHPDRFDK